jgi:rare lipoprotein A
MKHKLLVIIFVFITNIINAKPTATYYCCKFNGRLTASGEIFNENKLTAAHKTLPLGMYVKVINIHNDKTIIVKINDRLPKTSKVLIDLSKYAFEKIASLDKGIIYIKLEIINLNPF